MSRFLAVKAFADAIGDDLHRSGLIGTDNLYQARVIAVHCATTGRSLLSVPMEYHIIGNKLSLRADAMLARVRDNGGDHDVRERTPDAVEITVSYRGKSHTARLTWEEAQKETFPYAGKEKEILAKLSKGERPPLKVAYATPHRRLQQLWARVVSDTVRSVAPELIAGRYTPTEVADFSGITQSEVESLVSEVAKKEAPEINKEAPDILKQALVTTPDTKTESPSEVREGSSLLPRLMKLLDSAGVDESGRDNILEKRGVSRFEDLQDEQVAELLAKLEAFEERQHQQAAASEPVMECPVDLNGPITDDLVATIQQKLSAMSQKGASGIEFCKRVKAKLDGAGVKLAGLSIANGEKLLSAIEGKEVELFFEASLESSGGAQGKAA